MGGVWKQSAIFKIKGFNVYMSYFTVTSRLQVEEMMKA